MIYQWYVKVKDGRKWRDSGEGPFSTKAIAQEFIDAEVGVPAKVVKGKPQRNSAGGQMKRKNPTKAQRTEKTRKLSAKRRVAVALAKYLKQQNPGSKLAGATVEKLAGGVLKITPIKANRGRAR